MDTNSSFRLLDTGKRSAAENMALDEAILLSVASKATLPTIRFYAWKRPTVSIGYFQRARKEIDEGKIALRDFQLVRRMTGGRAVLHDCELTYSVMAPGDHALAKASVVESYRMLSEGLRQGFLELGLQAEIVSLADGRERAKFAAAGSAACFDSPSWYELVVAGRKIAGSAQVRAHNGLLQHGSLLLDLDADDLFDVLLFRSETDRVRIRNDFEERATSVKQLLGAAVSYETAAAAFAKGFSSGLPATLFPDEVTPEEERLAYRLQIEKYENPEWTFRR